MFDDIFKKPLGYSEGFESVIKGCMDWINVLIGEFDLSSKKIKKLDELFTDSTLLSLVQILFPTSPNTSETETDSEKDDDAYLNINVENEEQKLIVNQDRISYFKLMFDHLKIEFYDHYPKLTGLKLKRIISLKSLANESNLHELVYLLELILLLSKENEKILHSILGLNEEGQEILTDSLKHTLTYFDGLESENDLTNKKAIFATSQYDQRKIINDPINKKSNKRNRIRKQSTYDTANNTIYGTLHKESMQHIRSVLKDKEKVQNQNKLLMIENSNLKEKLESLQSKLRLKDENIKELSKEYIKDLQLQEKRLQTSERHLKLVLELQANTKKTSGWWFANPKQEIYKERSREIKENAGSAMKKKIQYSGHLWKQSQWIKNQWKERYVVLYTGSIEIYHTESLKELSERIIIPKRSKIARQYSGDDSLLTLKVGKRYREFKGKNDVIDEWQKQFSMVFRNNHSK